MAPKLVRSILILPMIVTALAALPASRAYAADVTLPTAALPDLATFTTWLNNGQSGQLRGVYVPNILADGVVQQPSNQATFVSPRQDIITQFEAASSLGSTGLLAHNFLAGEKFPQMKPGQLVYLVYGDGKPDGGGQAMADLLDLPERPTAVFCYNDLTALGAMRQLQASGLRVPEDMSVTGFDDLFISQYLNPPLTTVRQPMRQMGRLAMETLLHIFDHTDCAHNIRVEGQLVVRESTARPKERK